MNALTHSLISSDLSTPGSASATALAKSWSSIVSVVRMVSLVRQIMKMKMSCPLPSHSFDLLEV
jgi:hypothetical protein